MAGSRLGIQVFRQSVSATLAGQTVTDGAAARAHHLKQRNNFRRNQKTQTGCGAGSSLGLLLLVLVAAFALVQVLDAPQLSKPFRAMRITRLTTGGRIGNAQIKGYASISPDGKYVVFKTTEAGKDSLWVRQVSTGSLVEIVPEPRRQDRRDDFYARWRVCLLLRVY